jgi:hypothetical protein
VRSRKLPFYWQEEVNNSSGINTRSRSREAKQINPHQTHEPMTCRSSVEWMLTKAITVLERFKRGMQSAERHPFLASSRERHSRASQCETEAFWKKKPTRAEAIEGRGPERLYAAEKSHSF